MYIDFFGPPVPIKINVNASIQAYPFRPALYKTPTLLNTLSKLDIYAESIRVSHPKTTTTHFLDPHSTNGLSVFLLLYK
jgi:hypothetical protein